MRQSDIHLAALVPLAIALLLVGAPVVSRFFPVVLRQAWLSPRSRAYRNAAVTALLGLALALMDGLKALRAPIDGGDLFFTIVGGALIGLGIAQALAATKVNWLLSQTEHSA